MAEVVQEEVVVVQEVVVVLSNFWSLYSGHAASGPAVWMGGREGWRSWLEAMDGSRIELLTAWLDVSTAFSFSSSGCHLPPESL